MTEQAFQDLIPNNHCYGCGPANEHGLRLKSFWQADEAVAVFRPQPQHAAGPEQFLNGGIIATLIDCHCVGTAIAECYRREARAIGSLPNIWCVTAALKVDYLHPVSIEQPVNLRARVIEVSGRKIRIACSLFSMKRESAKAEVLAVRVSPSA